MLEEKTPLLVLCLGNPGKSYEYTRHNIGFLVGEALAGQLGCSLRHRKEFLGDFTQGHIGEVKVMILLPTTYMNLSGESLRRCRDFFKLPLTHLMVVCDDVALPFGKLRLRDRGSCGGHNGLKSVEMALGSQQYSRLKIGVGRKEDISLSDFVLGPFDPEEFKQLPEIVEQAKSTVLVWAEEGYAKAVAHLVPPRHRTMQEEKKTIKDEI